MNGVHDMGGMQGMGPIQHEQNEPVFHSPWEGRMFAIDRALARKWNIDAGRHQVDPLGRLLVDELLREMAYAEH